jgi:hypothetical protein
VAVVVDQWLAGARGGVQDVAEDEGVVAGRRSIRQTSQASASVSSGTPGSTSSQSVPANRSMPLVANRRAIRSWSAASTLTAK